MFKYNFLILFILTSIYCHKQRSFPSEPCKEAREWPQIGKANIQDYCGRVLLLTFISPRKCNSHCNNLLTHLNSLYDQYPSVRIMAVTPMNENERNIRLFASRYPKIRFEIENKDTSVWNWFRAIHLDQFIFDRCSRNSAKISINSHSSPSFITSTLNAIQSTISSQPCGNCDYDLTKPVPEWKSFHPPSRRIETKQSIRLDGTPNVRPQNVVTPRTSNINKNTSLASFNKQKEKNRNSIEKPSNQKNKQQKQQQHYTQYQQQQIITTTLKPFEENNLNNLLRQRHLELQERERLIREREERQRLQEEKQRKYWFEQQEKFKKQQHQQHQQLKQATQSSIIPSKQDERYFPINRGEEEGRRKSLIKEKSHQHSSTLNQIISSSSSQINNIEPAPLYPEGNNNINDEDYNYEEIILTTTTEFPPQNLQIPKPIKTIETTQPTIQLQLSSQQQQQNQQQQDINNNNFNNFDLSSTTTTCSSFSDESCYQQQTQLNKNEIHYCCRNRILLTDFCSIGKCSNLTIQLCCIQKFLQSKLKCCSDERLSQIKKMGDQFSRCCFENFIENNNDDICCPKEYANEQWKNIHELCLPNIELDLNEIKVPIPLLGTTLVTEFDFSKTDKWRFECRYGGHTRQFSYFEKSSIQEEGNIEEDSSNEED